MKFPSWSDFRDGVTNFDHSIYYQKTKITEIIQGLKDNHPVFDEIIKRSIPFLPSPFNGISQAIYSSFEGSKKDKVDEVLNFLKKIENQTEEHYNEITSQLGNVLNEISNIKVIVAKEDTLQLIKEILISKDNAFNKNLGILKDELNGIKKLHKDLYQAYGLNWLSHDYFECHKSTYKDIESWKEGFPFELEAIKERKEFRRNIVIEI